MDNDAKKGLVLIALAVVMFPVMMDMMQQHDDAVREHERECDMEYRLLVLDTIESPDAALCEELEDEMSVRVSYFIGSLGLFVLFGIGGLVLVLPYDNNDPKQPPIGGELRGWVSLPSNHHGKAGERGRLDTDRGRG